MAGGEFRFGTASIYMAEAESIWLPGTSHKCDITWLRFCGVYRRTPGLPPVDSHSKKEVGSNMTGRSKPLTVMATPCPGHLPSSGRSADGRGRTAMTERERPGLPDLSPGLPLAVRSL